MAQSIRILGIPGSLRQFSYNLSALKAAQKLLPEGVELEIATLEGIPPYNQDEEKNPPPAVVELKRRIRAADAILISTPEYNYSLPGVLKNAIDWASRPYGDSAWNGKPAAVMGATVGMLGTARAQYHLRQIAVFLNLYVMNQPEVMIGGAAAKFDVDGELTDEKTKEFLAQFLKSLVDWTQRVAAK